MITTERPAEAATKYVSIGEAAQRTGLTHRTLRYYEELGLLRQPTRISGGQRLYSPDDIARVERVTRMKKLLGFSLSEIKAAVEAEEAKQHLSEEVRQERSVKRRLRQMHEAAGITSRQLALVEEKIAQMRAMKRELSRDLAAFNEKVAQLRREVEGSTMEERHDRSA